MIAFGSGLLTPLERTIYHATVVIIIGLVTLGVVHQARFYTHAVYVLTQTLYDFFPLIISSDNFTP